MGMASAQAAAQEGKRAPAGVGYWQPATEMDCLQTPVERNTQCVYFGNCLVNVLFVSTEL
jgi:hypothetical protein